MAPEPHPFASLGPGRIHTIGLEELQAKLARGDDFKLIMALNRWAFDAKHIPGSLHFDTPEELYAAVQPTDEVVVYCSNVDCLSSVALSRARRTRLPPPGSESRQGSRSMRERMLWVVPPGPTTLSPAKRNPSRPRC